MVGVVLEGGGAKGSYQAGALLALKKMGIKIDGIVGTSIGAINAAFVAEQEYSLLKKLWYNATSKDVFDVDDELVKNVKDLKINKQVLKDSWAILIKTIKNRGLDKSKLKSILLKNINEEKVRKSKIAYGLVTYSLSKVKPIKIFKEDIPYGQLVDYILASAHFPFFKMEKTIDDKYYFDGGIYDNCPISMLLDKGYNQIIVIRTHAIGITKKMKKDANIVYIENKRNLGSIIFFDKDVVRENIKLGYYDAFRAMKNLDGDLYYIKNMTNKYYDELIIDSSMNLASKLKKEYSIKSNKELIITCLERVLNKEKINKYKIYSPFILIFMVKFLLKKKNTKEYKFLKSLKLHLY